MISLILPVYNDETSVKSNMPKIIRKMNDVKRNYNESYEIIVVEESSDRTPELVSSLAKKNRDIKHIHHSMRLGKGRAITEGIKKSRGDKILFMDIDLSTDLSAVDRLLENLDYYDIVLGSRFHPESKVTRPYYRSFLGFSLSVAVRVLFGLSITDTQCGFKAFRRDSIMHLLRYVRNNEWFWDIEVFYYAKKFSYKICEIPIVWKYNKLKNYGIFKNVLFYIKNILVFALARK